MKKKSLLLFAMFAALSVTGMAQKRDFYPPIMGWSTWNTFALNISDKLIRQQADAMVKTGLKDAGYVYINIDDGYWNGRADDGTLRINAEKFPNGMKPVADYVHSLGLKAGIYSDAGDNSCSSFNTQAWGLGVGLAGHEEADCKTYFVDWGYDFIKVDFCGASHMGLDQKPQYTKISHAIAKAAKQKGKRIGFNICCGAFPGTWASNVADSWRTTVDIDCTWGTLKALVRDNLYIQAYTGGGHYNDMDMLEIGRTFTPDEEKLHMAYWCIASSPLLIGCNLATIPDHSLKLLKNKDLLAMNQDRLGLGAPVVFRDGDVYAVAKDMEKLHGQKRAVVVMNLSDQSKTVVIPLKDLGFFSNVKVHDCFSQYDSKLSSKTFTVTVPAHGAQAYFMKGKRLEQLSYEAETAWMPCYQEIHNEETARYKENANASQGECVGFLGNNPENYMEWRDVYRKRGGTCILNIRYASSEGRDLEVTVNGKPVKTLTKLSSGDWNTWRTASVKIQLKKGSNSIRLGNATAFAPDIDKITINPITR